MNDKTKNALEKIAALSNEHYALSKKIINTIKDILTPCGSGECPIGTDDVIEDDIYYLYGEPVPNVFRRVLGIRYIKEIDQLEVRLELLDGEEYKKFDTDEDGWIDFPRANVNDYAFLLDEISSNLEYADGYQEDEFKYLVDEDGSKYNPETSTLSGGMDIRCDHNAEALYAYQVLHTREAIEAYLTEHGWKKTGAVYLEFVKGNTTAFFDDWRDEDGGYYVCFGTEYATEKEVPVNKTPVMRYSVPFLRTQWADVVVEADSRDEAISKAENIFNEGRDGDIEWEDIDSPEYDDVRGVDIYPYND